MVKPDYCMRTGENKKDCGCNRCQEEQRIANPNPNPERDEEGGA